MAGAPQDIRILTVRRRLTDLGSTVEAGTAAVESGYADLAEALLAGARSLELQAREADFTAPDYPPARRRAVELTLSETREMKFRVEPPEDRP